MGVWLSRANAAFAVVGGIVHEAYCCCVFPLEGFDRQRASLPCLAFGRVAVCGTGCVERGPCVLGFRTVNLRSLPFVHSFWAIHRGRYSSVDLVGRGRRFFVLNIVPPCPG